MKTPLIYTKYKTAFLTLLGIVTIQLIGGCSKELDIDIPEPEPKLVVEGWIEQGKPARVLLTQSVPFFSDLDSASLMEIPVTRAKVTLIGETGYEILTLIPNLSFFPPYVYNSTEMTGTSNQLYQLEVEYRGEKLLATTTIPEPVPLDSVWYQPEEENDSLGQIYIRFTDNPARVDYYRVLTQIRGKDKRYIPCYASTFSDQYISGESFTLGLIRGNGNVLELGENQLFRKGDTINIKFCTLDKEHFDFWNSVQAEILTSSNPYSVSYSTIKSNINGGYGIWGGYGASYYTIVLK